MDHDYTKNYEWNDIDSLEYDLKVFVKKRDTIKSNARKDDIDFIIKAIEDRIEELQEELEYTSYDNSDEYYEAYLLGEL